MYIKHISHPLCALRQRNVVTKYYHFHSILCKRLDSPSHTARVTRNAHNPCTGLVFSVQYTMCRYSVQCKLFIYIFYSKQYEGVVYSIHYSVQVLYSVQCAGVAYIIRCAGIVYRVQYHTARVTRNTHKPCIGLVQFKWCTRFAQ